MNETKKEPRFFDHRAEQFIDTSDMPFIKVACNLLGVKYEPLFQEGEQYAGDTNNPAFVPKGKSWIKMRANLSAGQGFNFVFDKAEELKKQSKEIEANILLDS